MSSTLRNDDIRRYAVNATVSATSSTTPLTAAAPPNFSARPRGVKSIHVEFSDGNASTFPTALSKDLRKDGTIYYYTRLDRSDHRLSSYLVRVAKVVVDELEANNLKLELGDINQDDLITLDDLPKDYALFDHVTNKQPKTQKDRTITCLCGHPSGKKFRSAIEFAPHLIWLLKCTDLAPEKRPICDCKLCRADGMGIQGEQSRKRSIEQSRGHLVTYQRMTTSEVQLSARKLLAEMERREDKKIGAAWYRPGEIVWYRVADGKGYIPAMIITRPSFHDEDEREYRLEWETEGYRIFAFKLSGVSGAGEALPNIAESELTPWLSRDPSQCQIPKVLDIVSSWSTIDKIGSNPEDGDLYNGLFFGAEKIWCGEAICVLPAADDPGTKSENPPQEIMVIEKIAVKEGKLWISGDLFVSGNAPYIRRTVPTRVGADRGWIILYPDDEVVIEGGDIKGRWYSRTLLPEKDRRYNAKVYKRVKSRRAVANLT
ncbi:uncharacterized protein V1518DRAFT_369495 [Limtongia smithiae]|uniref:uncharacterized protein n=1 Tax=Limtongia smithiae TaxID=1125753 RepID=UPI0034CDAC4A